MSAAPRRPRPADATASSAGRVAGSDPRRWLRGLGFTVGLALFAAAVVVVWRQREGIEAALEAARHPSLLAVLGLLAAVTVNIGLTAALIRRLLLRHGTVGRLEMQALIAAVGLVNYIPLRPGLFGRIAYHQVVNGIPAAATVKVMLQTVGLSVVVAAGLTTLVLATAAWDRPVWLGVAPPIPILAGLWAIRPRSVWPAVLLLRYLDVLVWAIRYACAFSIIGAPIEFEAAIAFACISMIATLVPFVSNGLGLREWAIGLLAPLVAARQLELGVTAELVNRGAEIVVFAGLGGAGIAWLAGHVRRVRGGRASGE